MHPTEDVINDYADGALDAAAAADLEKHLEDCPTCRQLADDLVEIRRVAGSLEARDLPARAWSRIERAIALEPGAARRRTGSRALYSWMAAAAAVVLAAWAGVHYYTTQPARSVVAPVDGTAEAVEAELREAEAHYDKAIKGLEQIASAEQSSLDPRTAATLQKNLAVIDQAISESRAAIRAQPASEPARASLMENFKTKLALLQDTVALINEMRKGNDQGTARIVSGLQKRGSS